jgi:hypothetical protein
VRSFSAFTSGLDALVEWLKQCGVTTVAMESTGVYWIALAQKLGEAGIEYVLANARHVHNVPGRKTDVKDCQWLQELHSYGLVSGSFRPDEEICKLRSLERHRGNVVSSASAEIQHMQKALQQMNRLAIPQSRGSRRRGLLGHGFTILPLGAMPARRLLPAGRSENESASKNQPRRRSIFALICRRSAGSTSRPSSG